MIRAAIARSLLAIGHAINLVCFAAACRVDRAAVAERLDMFTGDVYDQIVERLVDLGEARRMAGFTPREGRR